MAAALSFLNVQPQFNRAANRPLPALGPQSPRWLSPLEAVVRFFAPGTQHDAMSTSFADKAYASKAPMAKRQSVRKQCVHVLRVTEAGIPAGSAGRMRMSGRFSDVCAELDRLVAIEHTRSKSRAV